MTVEKPIDSAHLWMINATDQPVDVYVNYSDKPAITDVKRLEVGPQFEVKGKDGTPYGAYTFSTRPKADRNGEVLAEASVTFVEGKSFSAVLHQASTGDHQLSIYENDFSPSGDSRMTVRHNARPQEIAWSLRPNSGNPDIPVDERDGVLQNGQWQVATDVTQNDYLLEFLVGGEVVAEHPDLELEHEKNRTVYVVGDPQPTADPVTRRRHVLQQEFKLPPGPSLPDEVTAPAEPLSTTDQNQPIEFTYHPVELWETNRTTTQISAVDPDGVITNLSIDLVDPKVGGIVIPDQVDPSPSIGEPVLATVEVLGDVPAGSYEARIVANRGSLGHRATFDLPVTVKAITVARLRSLVSDYRSSGDIQGGFAETLGGLLDEAEHHLNAGDTNEACQSLKEVLTEVGAEKGGVISETAADHLDRETKSLRSDLGCG